ncbi:hypothetical protein EI534_08785 [Pseudomonas frederiksbergensis]|nr:hypothetical protein [Pseudomonas frederiksbergensis]
MARELAPVGPRSGPQTIQTASAGFTTAAQPSGSKLPRHKSPLATNEKGDPRWVAFFMPGRFTPPLCARSP